MRVEGLVDPAERVVEINNDPRRSRWMVDRGGIVIAAIRSSAEVSLPIGLAIVKITIGDDVGAKRQRACEKQPGEEEVFHDIAVLPNPWRLPRSFTGPASVIRRCY